MVSFAFETAGEECEPAPDLMDMINGGEHAIAPEDKPAPLITSEFPEFGEIEPPTEESNAAESQESAVEGESEEDIEQQIEEAKAAFTNMALMRSRVEEELKDIKESEKGLLKNLKRLLAMQFDQETKAKPKQEESKTEVDFEPSVEGNSELEEVKWVDADSIDPDWWNVSAESILEKVSGIGKKKKDSLLAVFSNLKQMEDLRGEASRQFKHFSEVLPDGIGKGLADQIEDAMLQAIR